VQVPVSGPRGSTNAYGRRPLAFATALIPMVVERHFVARPDGTYRRHPARQILDDMITDTFGADPPRNILEMFRGCTGPTLIIRCTRSNWPAVLDAELDDLVTTRPNIRVVCLPLTHTEPVTAGIDQTSVEILRFLAQHLIAGTGQPRTVRGAARRPRNWRQVARSPLSWRRRSPRHRPH
jgi:hypothetical protein